MRLIMLTENSSGQNLGGFRHVPGGPLESTILNFETLLQNFISISIISPNFRTICSVVTERWPEQDLGRKMKRYKRSKNSKPPTHPLRLGDFRKPSTRTKQTYVFTAIEAKGESWGLVKLAYAPSNSLLAVPRRCFHYG